MQIILVLNKKIIYEFAKEKNYDTKTTCRPSIIHSSFIKILESPAILASGISRTIILSYDPNELCDRLRILLQEKHAVNNSVIIIREIVAIVDKFSEYSCLSEKKHRQILINCNLLKTQV